MLFWPVASDQWSVLAKDVLCIGGLTDFWYWVLPERPSGFSCTGRSPAARYSAVSTAPEATDIALHDPGLAPRPFPQSCHARRRWTCWPHYEPQGRSVPRFGQCRRPDKSGNVPSVSGPEPALDCRAGRCTSASRYRPEPRAPWCRSPGYRAVPRSPLSACRRP